MNLGTRRSFLPLITRETLKGTQFVKPGQTTHKRVRAPFQKQKGISLRVKSIPGTDRALCRGVKREPGEKKKKV